MAVFIRQLLMGLVREFENLNKRSDHIDSVLYRIDWFYQLFIERSTSEEFQFTGILQLFFSFSDMTPPKLSKLKENVDSNTKL